MSWTEFEIRLPPWRVDWELEYGEGQVDSKWNRREAVENEASVVERVR